jgi:uncharacterized protein YndB with AHSA1/START domain
MERRLPHPPAKVWRAITVPEHLSSWFPSHVALDLRAGGDMTFTQAGDDGPEQKGTVLEVDPPRLLAFAWESSLLRFDLRPDGDGTVLTFSHTFDDRYGAASFTAGWRLCFDALDDVLAGRTPAEPTTPEAMAADHDRLVAELGLDEPEVTVASDGGWKVRLERQLTRSNAAAWPVLLDGPSPTIGDPAPPGVVVPGAAGDGSAGATGGVAAGTVDDIAEAELLAYAWRGDGGAVGDVRIELRSGTGQGGRLVVTQTGPAGTEDERDMAAAGWRARVDDLATRLRDLPPG